MGDQVNRDSFIPYYAQVKEFVLDRIKSDEWKVGEQLPGEPQLCKLFDVSRTVIRQAMNELVNEGLVIRRKGKGTFVAEPKLRGSLVQRLTGFHENMASQGKTAITQVLRQDKVAASRRIARFLSVERDAELIRIERLRLVQDEPIVLVSSYLPYSMFPNLLTLDLAGDTSLYAYIEGELGMRITRGSRTIEAVAANEYEAHWLDIERGAPLILLDSVSYLQDGTSIEYYHAVHRGDRSKFEVELVRALE